MWLYYDPIAGEHKVHITREDLRDMLKRWAEDPETKALFARLDAERKERVAKLIADAKRKEKEAKRSIKTLADVRKRKGYAK